MDVTSFFQLVLLPKSIYYVRLFLYKKYFSFSSLIEYTAKKIYFKLFLHCRKEEKHQSESYIDKNIDKIKRVFSSFVVNWIEVCLIDLFCYSAISINQFSCINYIESKLLSSSLKSLPCFITDHFIANFLLQSFLFLHL